MKYFNVYFLIELGDQTTYIQSVNDCFVFLTVRLGERTRTSNVHARTTQNYKDKLIIYVCKSRDKYYFQE